MSYFQKTLSECPASRLNEITVAFENMILLDDLNMAPKKKLTNKTKQYFLNLVWNIL